MQEEDLQRVIAASLAYPIVRDARLRLRSRGARGSMFVAESERERSNALYDREKDLLAIITETDL